MWVAKIEDLSSVEWHGNYLSQMKVRVEKEETTGINHHLFTERARGCGGEVSFLRLPAVQEATGLLRPIYFL